VSLRFVELPVVRDGLCHSCGSTIRMLCFFVMVGIAFRIPKQLSPEAAH
jgi:hypothetical protein